MNQTLRTCRLRFLFAFFFLAVSALGALSQTLAGDLTSPDIWKPERVPFSFKYGGKDSAQLLATWQITQETMAGKNGQIQRYAYTDPATHLKVTFEVRHYPDFPGVADWVLWFRNDGASPTPIIEDILPLHWAISASPGDCFLRHAQGSDAGAADFTPLEERFSPDEHDHLQSQGEDPPAGRRCPSSICKAAIMDSSEPSAGQETGRPTSLIPTMEKPSP